MTCLKERAENIHMSVLFVLAHAHGSIVVVVHQKRSKTTDYAARADWRTCTSGNISSTGGQIKLHARREVGWEDGHLVINLNESAPGLLSRN